MARAHWWKFRRGGKRVSKTPPRRSQLTQSAFYGAMYDAEDDVLSALGALESDGSLDLVADALDNAAQMVRDQADECDEKYNNLPDNFQQGGTGELLQNRSERCQELADALEQAASDVRDIDLTEEAESDAEEAREIVDGVTWEYE